VNPADRARQERADEILRSVHDAKPRHPGAIHYAIHVHDVEGRAEDGVRFASLFEFGEEGLAATGHIDRGNSHLIEGLARPDERYADLRGVLGDRRGRFEDFAPIDGPTPEVGPAWAP
jgi:hypothetical protein